MSLGHVRNVPKCSNLCYLYSYLILSSLFIESKDILLSNILSKNELVMIIKYTKFSNIKEASCISE